MFSDSTAEAEFYARSAFTAWEYALVLGRHDPTLWNAIKGSPFESLYRHRFHPPEPEANARAEQMVGGVR